MTRSEVRKLREQLEAHLKKMPGVQAEVGGATFDEEQATFRITFRIGTPEEAAAVKKAQWDRLCTLYGLKPSDFGRVVVVSRQQYKVIGLATNRRRYPIVAKCLSGAQAGKTILLTASAVGGRDDTY